MYAVEARIPLERHIGWDYAPEELQTSDGWTLTLHRMKPRQPRTSTPVLLIHGHATTAWMFFGAKYGGIAGALLADGRDVWAVELRGSRATHHRNGSTRVRIADKLSIDIPTVLEHIAQTTGCSAIDAVGHSLGGVLLYLRALKSGPTLLRRMVTVASPQTIPHAMIPAPLRSRMGRRMASQLGRFPLSSITSRLWRRAQVSWMPHHFDPDFNGTVYRNFYRWGVADVYGAELGELLAWIANGNYDELTDAPTPTGRRLSVPTRFLVGAADGLIPTEHVEDTFRNIGGPESDFHVLGKHTGYQHNYRHADILLADSVYRDVGPLVVDWLSHGLQTRKRALTAA